MARLTAKLSFASAGGKPNLEISSAAWQRIETAYQYQLSETLRQKICEATSDFLEWAVFERTASANSKAMKRAQLIKKAARDLRRAILQRPTNVTRDADFLAQHLISKHLYLPSEKGRNGLQNLVLKFERVVSKGCDLAISDLARERGSALRRGETWDLWVRKLTAILEAEGLPTEARKDTDKQSGKGLQSPFVGFLRELQRCIPAEFQRSTEPDGGALAQAIYQARSAPRREPKRFQQAPK
jgi:hypothetical protein